ncbi:AhpC/TSA family protein [Pedobacter polaris]|uniref:AhpC/TSA family protein n=1 Tax=Pedobacter polaris TaxID=2571273 RepID=A0A4U1CMJ0_9SPHI|nr:TlpA disulfide reductase family protein [Pedobacter polaris]TKC06642.1 AhpC/TSA family protein [Pedobacter polaris]
MKNRNMLSIALVLAPLLGAAQAGNPFTIMGKVADYQRVVDNTIYLKFKQNGKETKDSVKLINGTYTFKGKVSYPVKAVIQLKVADSVEKYHASTRTLKDYAHDFYIDKGQLMAHAPEKLNSTVIKGSKADDDRQELKAKLDPYYAASNKIYKEEGSAAYKSKDSVAIANYTKKSYRIQDQIDSVKKAYLFSHVQSGTVLDLLQEYTRTILEPSEIQPFFNKIQPSIKASAEGQAYSKRIEQSKVTALGAAAPDFILKDKNGKEISLSSMKGKLILLDFWGSWCGPCRDTHPHLKKLYAAYKSKGFEIFGVSNELSNNQEENYNKWVKAMDEDKMEWVNVLNDKSKGDKANGVLSKYSVTAFPTKILIDKDGRIIRRLVGSGVKSQEELVKLLQDKLH